MIRQYCEEDLPGIVDLVACFSREASCFEVVGGFSREHFLESLKFLESVLRIWIIDSNGVIVSALAMAEYVNLYSGKKGLEELFWFSIPENRGNRENVQLLDIAKDYAVKNQLVYMAMGSMVNSYPSKIELFYRRRGFELHQKHYFCSLEEGVET